MKKFGPIHLFIKKLTVKWLAGPIGPLKKFSRAVHVCSLSLLKEAMYCTFLMNCTIINLKVFTLTQLLKFIFAISVAKMELRYCSKPTIELAFKVQINLQ